MLKTSKWIASLLRCGLIPASFIPARPIRELRELNRTRRKLVGMMASEKNRIQKVLEDANIKLASVVSKIDGVSSMNMIQALLKKDKLSERRDCRHGSGQAQEQGGSASGSSEWQGKRSSSIPSQTALEQHRVSSGAGSRKLMSQIQKCMIPFQKEEHFILTIPGINKTYSIGNHL